MGRSVMTTGKRLRGYAQVNKNIGCHMSEDELVSALSASCPAIAMTGFHGLELTGLDAQDATFNQIVFRDCIFDGVDFSRSGFTDVVFEGCRFLSCSMEACWLNRVDFRSCSAPGISFAKGRFTGVAMEDAQVRYANFSEVNIKGLRVRSCSLAESAWRATRLSGASFDRCDLSRAEFARTPLAGIDFSSCDIAGIIVSSDFRELRGCIIAPEQAAELIGLLGVRIRED